MDKVNLKSYQSPTKLGNLTDDPKLRLVNFSHTVKAEKYYIDALSSDPNHQDFVNSEIKKHYPEIIIKSKSFYHEFGLSNLTEEKRKEFFSDIFLAFQRQDSFEIGSTKEPSISKDTFCAHFSNFRPDSDSQQKAMMALKNLNSQLNRDQAIFIYLHGKGGRGKTHLALSAAKSAIQNSKKVYYFSGVETSLSRGINVTKLNEADLIVIDDLNSGSKNRDLLKEIFDFCHKNKKKVIITSNQPIDKIIESVCPEGDDEEKERLTDRIKSNLVNLEIKTEESHRNKGHDDLLRAFGVNNTRDSDIRPKS